MVTKLTKILTSGIERSIKLAKVMEKEVPNFADYGVVLEHIARIELTRGTKFALSQ